MIFVTVGGQLPFDRFVRCIDEWAARTARSDVVAQIGEAAYVPLHVAWERFLTPAGVRKRMSEADAVVGHAGVGTILTALDLGRPLLLFPRRAHYREHRNDHQLRTARYFSEQGYVQAAFTEVELVEKIESLRAQATRGEGLPPPCERLIQRIRAHIFDLDEQSG